MNRRREKKQMLKHGQRMVNPGPSKLPLGTRKLSTTTNPWGPPQIAPKRCLRGIGRTASATPPRWCRMVHRCSSLPVRFPRLSQSGITKGGFAVERVSWTGETLIFSRPGPRME